VALFWVIRILKEWSTPMELSALELKSLIEPLSQEIAHQTLTT